MGRGVERSTPLALWPCIHSPNGSLQPGHRRLGRKEITSSVEVLPLTDQHKSINRIPILVFHKCFTFLSLIYPNLHTIIVFSLLPVLNNALTIYNSRILFIDCTILLSLMFFFAIGSATSDVFPVLKCDTTPSF